ncbi:MAG: site-specific integrase [Acidobacteriota bacterium]|nr:site-specific integrase [Acidobacteriota bacterium]
MQQGHHISEWKDSDTLLQANTGVLSAFPREEMERMARRRFQDPKPKRDGNWWYLRIRQDVFTGGRKTRKLKRVKLAPASVPEREVRKIAAEMLRPVNQGLITVGSAVNFNEYVQTTYIPTELPLLAKTTQDSYQGIIAKCLEPKFSDFCLRDLTPLVLQRYFSGLAGERVAYPTILKIRDTLSSILRSAVRYGFLIQNPMVGLKLPVDKRPRRQKPVISPEQLSNLVEYVSEPYASMLFVSVWTGLRISELIGLKWRCVHGDSITVEERYCRGDWSTPKTNASAATIGVALEVVTRIQRLKTLTVEVRAGTGTRRYQVVKSAGPDDLVFQSVKDGKPMSDQNVLKRHIQPVARRLGLDFVDWQCLRRSYATWLVQAGADPKSVQGQMRHTRISTTMNIYAMTVPAAQRVAIEKLNAFAKPSPRMPVTLLSQ